MTVIALDSSIDRPDAAAAAAAKAGGVGMWFGYLATKPAVGLEAPWDLASFNIVRAAGMGVGAFVSGWDDPLALVHLASLWGISRVLVDVEDGIRGDGSWVDGFLGVTGFGLYGLSNVMYHQAPYKIVADYPTGGCPGDTWPSWLTPPNVPHGWQCEGTHTAFGVSVDKSMLDNWFLSVPVDPPPIATNSPMEASMVWTAVRPDGNVDKYVLVANGQGSFACVHVIEAPDSTLIWKDILPGNWLAGIEAGYYTLPDGHKEAYWRGVGTDLGIWQTVSVVGVDVGWEPPVHIA